MEIKFGFDKQGGFIAGFAGTNFVEYAYPTSEYATAARRHPEKIATLMAASSMRNSAWAERYGSQALWEKISD